jgi:spermidine synthase
MARSPISWYCDGQLATFHFGFKITPSSKLLYSVLQMEKILAVYGDLKKIFTISRRYQVAAFISGFVLMAYELAGSRILSPVVGSSTYVWTGIIGVIVAALSVGYFLGGRLADRRQRSADIALLLVASAAAIASTLLLGDVVLAGLSGMSIDVRIKSLIASLILFAPASVLLGAISPYLARMHTPSLQQTGRSIATLSALNSLGGITGTFLVGFVFFGFIGSRETLFVLVGLLVLCSLLLATKDMRPMHIKVLAALLLVSALSMSLRLTTTPAVASIETPISSYLVRDVLYNGQRARILVMGPGGYQSAVYLDGSKELVIEYTRAIAQAVALHENPKDILIIGGGTFTMPEYFAREYPAAQIDVVEIDPGLEGIAKKYFSYSEPKNVAIHAEDARMYMLKNERKYDVIITDAFSDTGIPFSLTTTEFASRIAGSLKPRGVVLSNIIAANNDHCRQLLGSIYGTYAEYMRGTAYAVRDPSLRTRQNIIAAFSKDNDHLLRAFGNASVDTSKAVKLTDNYTPSERFHQNCLNSPS